MFKRLLPLTLLPTLAWAQAVYPPTIPQNSTNLLPLNNTWTGTNVFNAPSGYGAGFIFNQTWTGNPGTAISPNSFNCTATTLTMGSSSNAAWCLTVNSIVNGPTITGSPGGANFNVTLDQPTNNGAGGGFYNAFGTLALANSGDGGAFTTLSSNALSGATSVVVTSATNIYTGDYIYITLNSGYPQSTVVTNVVGTTISISPGLYGAANVGNLFSDAKGVIDGGIIQSQANAGGKALFALLGGTVAAYSVAGSSTYLRSGLTIENDVPFNVAATGYDAMLSEDAQAGVTAYSNYGILTSDIQGVFPLGSSATLWKAGGLLATAGGSPANWTVANDFDFTTMYTTGYFAEWLGPKGIMSINASGQANLASMTLKQDFPTLTLNDTHATVTTGGLVRWAGNGSGTYFYQVNTAAGGDFSSVTNAISINSAGLVYIPANFQLGPQTWADNQTCSAGQIAVDSSYIYVCTAANTVKRVALSAF